ncbi:MAG: hypothetical protein A4S12_09435 [Proteobacteria bacterium SG_bin5]|nr:mechanosensitive ion channel family protein [Sphingomonas sp.]OQW40958.1 MAG: hypothetical protein A4S12_09435 [Proteobacteria bacterium SG_bin5]
MNDWLRWIPPGLLPWAKLAIGLALALLVHQIALILLKRIGARVSWLPTRCLVQRLREPSRWLLIGAGLAAAGPTLNIGARAQGWWAQAAGLIMPALFGWLAVGLIGVAYDVLRQSGDLSAADNLRARRQQTRAGILYRVVITLVVLVTLTMMLMSIPAVRSIGVTLAASAGIAGLAVGAAAQPLLKNLVAGVQMAFTEPIRLDDVVIIDGEWGRIEEIRLTYVVVKIWDERRLVVPVSKFLEDSFQNWTRQTSQLLGTVFLHLDPRTDIPKLRAELERVTRANAKWDGRVVGLQVTEATAQTMEVRALVSAADAGRLFDLRCEVREALIAYLRDQMPEALARQRLALPEPAAIIARAPEAVVQH